MLLPAGGSLNAVSSFLCGRSLFNSSYCKNYVGIHEKYVNSAPVIFHWLRSSSFASAVKTLKIKILLTFPGI